MSQASLTRSTEQIAEFFARGPSPQEIAAFRLPDATLSAIRELPYKNSAGTLTAEESQELDELVLLDRIVNLIQSCVPRASQPPPEQHASDER
jgi:hypothetical protein